MGERKEKEMRFVDKRLILWLVSAGFLLGILGCQTTGGFNDSGSGTYGFEKPQRDTRTISGNILKLDDWIRENVW